MPNNYFTYILENQRKIKLRIGILVIIFFFSLAVSAQNTDAYIEARDKLVKKLKSHNIDKALTDHIEQFYYGTCDSLLSKKTMVEDRPIEVILTRLFDASENKLTGRFITSLRIPSVNDYFLQTLKQYGKQPILNLYRQVGISQSAILEFAFDGLALGDSISSILGIREMLNNPYYVSTRLHQPKYAPYKDTLMYFLANAEPALLQEKLAVNDSLFTSLARRSKNRTVQMISQIEKDIYYDQVIPFGMAIYEGRITADSIRKLALVPSAYYKAFTEEILRLNSSTDNEMKAYLKLPLAAINKTLANKYYINEVNRLHDSPDTERFASVSKLSTRELYFLLVGGSVDLYTSSFLYLYKKFIKDLGKDGLGKFLDEINYYQFDEFISNVLAYGLLNDMIDNLEEGKFAPIAANYLRKISSTQLTDQQVILNSMTAAEILEETYKRPGIQTTVSAELDKLALQKANDMLLQRIFSGFRDILQDKAAYKSDATYDVLPVKRLLKKNSIVQACFFYDDEDGVSSFNNSVGTYSPELWEKVDKGNYIVFTSIKGNAMRVYMNKPNAAPGSDSTQDEMLRDMAADGYEPTSFIHRGHSYHLQQSLRKITPSAQFVFLGSCGGYNEVLNVFQLNPDVNIIVTRNIGSKLINDPLLQKINTELVNNQDIHWDKMWKEFDTKFQAKHTRDLFSSYIPPNDYVGVKFIRKVFNY